MKLYVWHEVLLDYTAGMVCVMAESEEQARMFLATKPGFESDKTGKRIDAGSHVAENVVKDILNQKPLVLEAGEWSFVWGGG